MSRSPAERLEYLRHALSELEYGDLSQALLTANERFVTDLPDDRLPMDLAVEQLHQALQTLRALIEKPAAGAVPSAVYRDATTLIGNLRRVTEELIDGSDRRVQFVEQAEGFVAFLWRNQILRSRIRTFDLEAQLASVDEYKARLHAIIQMQQETSSRLTLLDQEFTRMSQGADRALENVEDAREAAQLANAGASSGQEAALQAARDAAAKLKAIETTEAAASQILAELRAARTEIQESAHQIESLLEIGTKFKEDIRAVQEKAASTIDENAAKTADALTYLEGISAQANEALVTAVSGGLFKAFHERSAAVAKGKAVWMILTVASILGITGIAIWAVAGQGQLSDILIRRFVAASPLIVAAFFCASQYARERRLEEIYEFKGRMSLSLNPYRKLIVDALAETGTGPSSQRYTDFLIQTVEGIFTAPISPIGGKEANPVVEAKDAVGETADKIRQLVAEIAKLNK
ncbi:MAG: hypothetical protein ACO1SV_27720 [Fimbriimonas sp.]